MRPIQRLVLLPALALSLLGTAPGRAAETERSGDFDSAYNHIIVEKTGSVISMRRMENGGSLSAVDLADPERQIFPYTAYMFGACLVNCAPRNALSIGLGAGSINRLFVAAFPESKLTTVDVDAMIIELAEKYFGYKPAAGETLVNDDGRRFLRRTEHKFDWVFLDAFIKNSQIPPHLTTREFFALAQEKLTGDGVFIANLHFGKSLFPAQLATMHASFGYCDQLMVKRTGNIIVMCAKNPYVLKAGLDKISPERAGFFLKRAIDFPEIAGADFPAATVLKPDTPLLTDDFAPVEYYGLHDH